MIKKITLATFLPLILISCGGEKGLENVHATGFVVTSAPIANAEITTTDSNPYALDLPSAPTTISNSNGLFYTKDFLSNAKWLYTTIKLPQISANATAKLIAPLPSSVEGYATGEFSTYINIPNTLVAAYMISNPGVSLSEAQIKITNYLGLPSGYDLGPGLLNNNKLFSPSKFISAATSKTTFDDYVKQEIEKISRDSTYTNPYTSVTLQGIFSFIAENIAKGALSAVGGRAANSLLDAIGFSSGSPAPEMYTDPAIISGINGLKDDLASVQKNMLDLKTSLNSGIDYISKDVARVKQEVIYSQYQNVANPTVAIASQINAIYTDLKQVIAVTPAMYAEQRYAWDSKLASVYDRTCQILKSGGDESLNTTISGSAAGTGSIVVTASKLFAAKRFYSYTDSENYQKVLDYFNSLSQALYVLIDFYYAAGVVLDPVIGYGNCSSLSYTSNGLPLKRGPGVLGERLSAATKYLAQQEYLTTIRPIPLNSNVIIDKKSGLMIYTTPVSQKNIIFMGSSSPSVSQKLIQQYGGGVDCAFAQSPFVESGFKSPELTNLGISANTNFNLLQPLPSFASIGLEQPNPDAVSSCYRDYVQTNPKQFLSTATKYASGVDIAKGWRLPTYKEAMSIWADDSTGTYSAYIDPIATLVFNGWPSTLTEFDFKRAQITSGPARKRLAIDGKSANPYSSDARCPQDQLFGMTVSPFDLSLACSAYNSEVLNPLTAAFLPVHVIPVRTLTEVEKTGAGGYFYQ